MMSFKPKRIPIRVGHRYVAILNETSAEKLDVRASERIDLFVGKKELTAIVDITDNKELKDNQIGLFAETWDKLGVTSRNTIKVKVAPKPQADQHIKEKLEGERLTAKEMDIIVKDIVNDDLSDIEMTYFVAGCFTRGLSDRETADLTKAIVKHGGKLTFRHKIVMDKHCIGGVPGNRTTMLVVPMITALGYVMPKTSSRAITSPSGTADTMEVVANVKNDVDTLKKIAKKAGGFITWGGGVDLAAADDKLIRVRYPLKLDPQGMLLASIMAKKYSVSSNNVIIDIPMGDQGKVKTKKEANVLKKRFLRIAKLLGMKMKVVITSADQPVGYGIGPLFEVEDIMKILKNEPGAPEDLKKKSIMLVTELLYLTGKYKFKYQAKKEARAVLETGKAWKQFQKIVKAQGKKRLPKRGEHTFVVKAKKAGTIKSIHNKLIANIARTAGAPQDKGAGIIIHKKIGDIIKKGEPLYTVYTENKTRITYVKKLQYRKAYTIK
ncbi:thymidine phosphorylase [Candidatus Peregrinibacteria bacterium]|nr:thymidine phosphorylase [Candidatus Peregrinibacteria bacterium]